MRLTAGKLSFDGLAWFQRKLLTGALRYAAGAIACLRHNEPGGGHAATGSPIQASRVTLRTIWRLDCRPRLCEVEIGVI